MATNTYTTSAEDGYIDEGLTVTKTADDVITMSSSSMHTVEKQAFFFFNVSSLPGGATINAVRFIAYLNAFIGVIENGSEVHLYFRDNGTTLDAGDFDNGGTFDGLFCNDSFFDPQLITYPLVHYADAISGALAASGRLGIRLETFNVTSGDSVQWNFDSFEKSGGIPATLEVDYTVTGTAFSKTINETLTISELFTKAISRTRTETVTLSVVISNQAGKVLVEASTLSAALIKAIGKNLIDPITATEYFIKSLARTISETLSLSEVFATIRGRFKTITETITLTESFLRAIGKNLLEQITITATLVKSITRSISETVTITDIFDKVKGMYRTLTETITITDIFSKLRTAYITVLDRLGHVENIYIRVNGRLTNLWRRIVQSSSDGWTRVEKVSGNWTRRNKDI